MNYMNSLVVEGHLVRDPEFKITSRGSCVCKFSIAANRMWKTSAGEYTKEVSYFDVETWGTSAEICGKKCHKGQGVRVIGRLKQNRWTDAEGKPHSRVSIVAEQVEFKTMFTSPAQNSGEAAAGNEENITVPTEEIAAETAMVF
ncbi:MAG: single-stranded DNA-binding protein [Bacteroides sp.]|nr:single-stranded DNA-binding protein [Prevotella sp.]MCM1407502.1 single-stranded DNA-binding protein [Treponema brennaborense]MCM1469992.1 single-stranded DNA-binding protein [Bacteroides sp.]